MKKMHKTAKGNPIDMNAIIRQNEQTLAVSNSRMNARGDILDNQNRVLVPVEQLSRTQHKISEPANEMKMSETENITKSVKSKKTVTAKKTPKEVNRVEKTDVTGNKIIEIEYDDGNIEVVKEENDENNSAN
jgi:hypothetical protein